MVIVDPAIAFDEATTGTDYKAKNLGVEKDLFIKDATTGEPLEGKVWPPGTTVFPDFTDVENATDYYVKLNEDFYKNQVRMTTWIINDHFYMYSCISQYRVYL